ncbi:equistatin-like [Tubulanus polymorphus]|uniref:equistatin-like n=1 Tax=Tubulanus polymorphus TaxID=672921 RepID=UPI003DA1CA78
MMRLIVAAVFALVVLTASCGSSKVQKSCIESRRGGLEATRRGMMGAFVPKCDADGSFSAVQRRGSAYFCVSREGETIPGYGAPIHLHAGMNCRCARDQFQWRKKKLLGLTFRCLKNGNYAPVQCRGSVCYCVDPRGRKSEIEVSIGHIRQLVCPYAVEDDVYEEFEEEFPIF